MHHRGLLHGDLNWRNILAAREGGGLRFYLVDLDGSRLVTTMSQRQAVRDLDHFLRDLERSGAGPELREAFLGHWRRAANSAVPSP
jgi:tRNA A-37 threonylcarbamoyl transferase component Bud32